MKNTKFLTIFLLTFLLGCLTVFAYFSIQRQREKAKTIAELNELANFVNTNKDPNTQKIKIATPIEENFEFETEDAATPNYKIDMLLTGNFHGDEVNAKSGEKWLGFFVENGKSKLAWTKLKVRRVRDFMDDEKLKERNGKSISIAGQIAPVFLLKNANMLTVGEIKTVFHSDKEDKIERYQEQSITSNKYRRDFKVSGITFTLKMAGDSDISKGKLVLISGETEQVISDNSRNRIEYIDLLWAGDLDNDGKLDLYINLARENVTGYTLFLSSQAEKGKLVKDVAVYRTVGC